MQSWDDVVGSSEAWQALSRFDQDIADLESRHAGHQFLQRARNLAEQLKSRLQTVDTDLVYPALLEDLGPALDRCQQMVRAHLEPPDGVAPTLAEDVRTALDEVAKEYKYLPVSIGGTSTDAPAIVEAMRQELAALSAQARANIGALSALVESLTGQLAELRDGPVVALNTRIETASQEITQAIANANALQTSFSTAFASSEDTRKQDYANELLAVHTAVEQAATELRDQWNDTVGENTFNADQLIEHLEEKRTEAVGLVHAIGRAGLTAGFGEWEKSERKSATGLRWTSVFFGAVAAVVVIVVVLHHLDDDTRKGTDWALTVGTVTIASALGAVSKYCATESAKHRTNAVFARRQALDLASFGPFIETLTENERAVMTSYFVPIFFGQASAADPRQAEALASLRLSPTQVIEALKLAMKHRQDATTT